MNQKKNVNQGKEKELIRHIDYNLSYLTQMFKKIKFKPIESYVAQRIWHLLDDTSVEMICQQYVKRPNGYALLDIYFPQIDYGIEIDEAYHSGDAQIVLDKIRERDIIASVNITIRRITCFDNSQSDDSGTYYLPLDDIHCQIDSVVCEIRCRLRKKKGSYRPWFNEDVLTPDYHKKIGILRIGNNDCFRNTLDICRTFGLDVKSNRRGGKVLNKEYFLWWPNEGNKDWKNELLDDGKTFRETYIKDTSHDSSENQKTVERKRITFFKETNNFGVSLYRFVGVFGSPTVSVINGKTCTIFERVEEEVILP